MKNRFTILFSIAIYHSYFKNDICNFISVQPDEATGLLMQRFGFVNRTAGNHLFFYETTGSSLEKKLGYITSVTGATSFGFTVTTMQAFLFNMITDLPVAWKGELLYDSSSGLNTAEQNTVGLQYALPANRDAGCTGKINIRFSDILNSNNGQQALQFVIRFGARATQWNYYIINKMTGRLTEPVIVSRSGPAVFGAPQEVTLQNGEPALLFSSGTHLIPLSNVPQQRFSLVDKAKPENQTPGKKGHKVICQNLPLPNPLRIAKDQDESRSFSSPVYVYV